jgi:hypothetical protein
MNLERTLLAALALVLAAIAGCGSDDEPAPTTSVAIPSPQTTTTETTPAEPAPPPEAGQPPGPAETPTADPRRTELEREAGEAVREYVAALDAGDGAAVCALLAEDALSEVELPEPRDTCAASLSASIGYRDPRGLPVWEGARVAAVVSVELDPGGREARVVATVVTTFADREEPSIEDDVVYLVRDGERWLVVKASSTLHRAIGAADVPPTVIAPP